MTGVIIWLVVIQIAVILHEGAHYLLARMQGAQVKAFSVGMGPILARFQAAGTEWRLSMLPIGGYVEIDGMAPNPDSTPATTGYARMSPLGKIAVLLAGPLSNWLLAVLLIAGTFYSQGIPHLDTSRAVIEEVVPGSAAERDGIKAGDVVVAIDGEKMPASEQVDNAARPGYMRLQDAIRSKEPNTLNLQRGEQTVNVPISFEWSQGKVYGIRYTPKQNIEQVEGYGGALLAATQRSFEIVPQALQSFVRGVGQTFTAPLAPNNEVSGPVASAQAAGDFARLGGWWGIVTFAALINMSLAIFNLIPIPGLDGGRILLVLIGVVMRQQLKPAQENLINFTGFVFLMVFMALVLLGDIARVIP